MDAKAACGAVRVMAAARDTARVEDARVVRGTIKVEGAV
jgi:hypothetical protein